MIERPGATFALSLLILLVAALALYRKEPQGVAAEAVATAAPEAAGSEPVVTPAPPARPKPAVDVAAAAPAPVPVPPSARVESPQAGPDAAPAPGSEPAKVAAAGRLVAAAAGEPPEPAPPQPTFGVAWPGGHDPVAEAAEPAPPAPAPLAATEAATSELVGVTSPVGALGDTPAPAAAAVATSSPPAESPPISRVPTAPLTAVREGESLAAVAERIYGSTRATHSLWLVNRDALDSEVAPLQAGMVLRTPPLSH